MSQREDISRATPARASGGDAASDHVDRLRAAWAREWPELDTAPVAVVARVGRLARHLDRGLERVFAEHGLTREGFDVLAGLRRAGAPYRLTPTELYRSLMRTSGAMTNRLKRLEDAGLVRRVADPADGRVSLVELTPKGRRLFERVAPLHLANERAMLAALDDAEREQLAALLRKLLTRFEDEAEA
jgi:DNA-binding MarR family transcriptional regulator